MFASFRIEVIVCCRFNLGGHCKLCGSKDSLPMQGDKRHWYHVACMALNSFIVPESRLKFGTRLISIENPQKGSDSQQDLGPCSICTKSEGLIYNCSMMTPKEFESQSTIECSRASKCNVRFHPLCAFFVDTFYQRQGRCSSSNLLKRLSLERHYPSFVQDALQATWYKFLNLG